jgi:hypothetical protein
MEALLAPQSSIYLLFIIYLLAAAGVWREESPGAPRGDTGGRRSMEHNHQKRQFEAV